MLEKLKIIFILKEHYHITKLQKGLHKIEENWEVNLRKFLFAKSLFKNQLPIYANNKPKLTISIYLIMHTLKVMTLRTHEIYPSPIVVPAIWKDNRVI